LNIGEMIEELTQPAGTKVLKISDEVAVVGTTSGVGESSQPGELLKGLPLISPQPGRYQHSIISLLVLSLISSQWL